MREKIYSKGEFIGPYEVERVLATGGMAIVYEAKPDPELRGELLAMGVDRVAVKVVRLDEASLSRHERKLLVERLDREFETLAKLSRLGHPNVVRVYDVGRDEGVPYYAMELVDGVTLDVAMAEQPRWGQMMHVFGKLCGAVAFLHEGGICHRDIKPSNVLIRRDGGEPVLIDFGICLPPSQRTLTRAEALLGTPQYLSPEYSAHWLSQSSSEPYVPAPTDDVWAMGVILYEILTGRSPWRSSPERRELLLEEIKKGTAKHPSEVYRKAPRALGDVAMKLMAPKWQDRPRNAIEALNLLGPAAEVSDVLGRIPPRRSAPRVMKTNWRGPTSHRATGEAHAGMRPPRRDEGLRLRTLVVAAGVLVVMMLLGGWILDRHTHSVMDEDRNFLARAVSEQLLLQNKMKTPGGEMAELLPVASAQTQPAFLQMSMSPEPTTLAASYMPGGMKSWMDRQILGGTPDPLIDTPIPALPSPYQALPPCWPGEEVINGGCWKSRNWVLRPGTHCPPSDYRYQDQCYQPVRNPKFPLHPPTPKASNDDWSRR